MLAKLKESLARARAAHGRAYADGQAHAVEEFLAKCGMLEAAVIGSLLPRSGEHGGAWNSIPTKLRWENLGADSDRVELDAAKWSGASMVWFNLTSSLDWSGSDNGIIRVERRLAQELSGAVGAEHLRFCRLKRGAFHSCDADGKAGERCDFQPGDWLMSVGLDWGHGMVDALLRLRLEGDVRIASMCHDVIPFIYPQYCHRATVRDFPPYFLKLAAASELMFCVSENTKRDAGRVLRDAGAPVPRMEVIRLGDNLPSAGGTVRPEIQELCRRKFMLCVSTLERRKNHRVLYHALRLIKEALPEDAVPLLVLAGKPGWGVTDLMSDIALDPVTQGHIQLVHGASDAELSELYQHAACCLFPSYYEGWGLPVAEALAHGKVVLASNSSSIPEIGGDLITYLDPLNPREWARAMEEQMTNPDARAAREAVVRSVYRPHMWSATAAQVAAALR
jgi:glycosyltransferase involved in cell wall biosynthesis